jgi:hypothetical protein
MNTIDHILVTDTTEAVDVGNGVIVLLKKELTYVEEINLASLAQKVEKGRQGDVVDMEAVKSATINMLRIGIVGWEGVTGKDGQPVAWQSSYVEKFKTPIAMQLMDRIRQILEARFATQRNWEKKDGEAGAVVPAGQSDHLPADSSGSGHVSAPEVSTTGGGTA